ncbi:MAG: hypothetical protein KC468_15175 [Myxococcales bacterium]|nr:hypothetical protein [Myxococcales bacterium]
MTLLVRLDGALRRALRSSPDAPLLRPYSSPARVEGEAPGLRYVIGVDVDAPPDALAEPLSRARAEFESWPERPEGAALALRLR